jgi:hypothetical protein
VHLLALLFEGSSSRAYPGLSCHQLQVPPFLHRAMVLVVSATLCCLISYFQGAVGRQVP